MLSIHNISSAGQAASYFSQDNYYTVEDGLSNSEWYGSGAKDVGLEGNVKKEEFFEILDGRINGQQLGKKVKDDEGNTTYEHRPGYDLTFSAPKSVSIMAEVGGSDEIRQAHENAVKSTLSYIEKEMIQTRQMNGAGEIELKNTGNAIVALFRHNTSRELDPQTHTHAVVMNATKGGDGKWRSVSNEALYNQRMMAGAIYTSELAKNIKELGYQINITDEKGNFEIKGFSREQLDAFSKRREIIKEEIKKMGLDPSSASAELREIVALNTRDRKSEVNHEKLQETWGAFSKSIGIDFSKIEENRFRVNEGDKAVEITARDAVKFSVAHLTEREFVFDKHDVQRIAIEHSAGRVSPLDVLREFNDAEKGGEIIKLPDGKYTTINAINSEKWGVDQISETRGKGFSIVSKEILEKRVEELEAKQGFQFTTGQKEAVTKGIVSEDRFVAVQGLAGTGKTTMLKAFRTVAEENQVFVRGMAPTGAAAKVMAKETGLETTTVSKFLLEEKKRINQQAAGKTQPRGKEVWIVDESSFLSQSQMGKLESYANTVGAKVVFLGDKLQLQGVSAGKPFELAQDHGIDTAKMVEISRQKVDSLKNVVGTIVGTTELKEGERLSNINLKRNDAAFDVLVKNGAVIDTKARGGAIDALVSDINKMSAKDRANTIVITAFNKDRQAINAGVRAGLRAKGELGNDSQTEVLVAKGWTRAFIKEAQYYNSGDVVRFAKDYRSNPELPGAGKYAEVVSVDQTSGIVSLKRDDGRIVQWEPKKANAVEVYNKEEKNIATGDSIRITRNGAEIKNNEIGVVKEIKNGNVHLVLNGDEKQKVHQIPLKEFKHWDHAYASTVHAAQGATKQKTLFHIRAPEGESSARDMEKMAKVFGDRAFYVGVTRASHEIAIYTDNPEFARTAVTGVQNKASPLEQLAEKGPSVEPEKQPGAVPEKRPSVEPEKQPGAAPEKGPSVEPEKQPGAVPEKQPGGKPQRGQER